MPVRRSPGEGGGQQKHLTNPWGERRKNGAMKNT